ncbi:MAG TPA: NAD(P)-dependent oxidoreductase [Caulobacteraceae bacterium]|jgi:glutamate synthase (NADPH/NADH) small chain|nr:NAD(P)-dependent oxidoreductase [Caulobacteraceae bacterium]
MARDLNRFVHLGRTAPAKATGEARSRAFGEVYQPFTPGQSAGQSSRCAQCGVPFCQSACPLHNNIPDWLNLASQGRHEEAWRMAAATSTMPEICGRICPQDRLCEGACVLEQSGWEGVTIGSVEKQLGDMAFENGWVDAIRPHRELDRSVGVIGAGPAGLAAADRLRERGYAVTIYDRHDRPGGLLVYGIPGFKLEKSVVERRTRRLADGGVTFAMDFEVGRDASLEELRTTHDAVLIASGVYKARRLSAPGCGSHGLSPALDYLIASNRKGFGDAVPDFESGRLNAQGRDVVVLGGGDTAMDCVRTAVRQGARSVVCAYRRDRENMPGSAREVTMAEEEGVRFEWLAAPKALLADARTVDGVRFARMQLGARDAHGRRSVDETPGAEFDLPAQMVVEALGFDPEDYPTLYGAPDLALTDHGAVRLRSPSSMTSLPGVFAAGDAARGASLVVWAVRDGQRAAVDIDRWISAQASEAAA